ncbi:WRKY transcription factor, partial [Trifolium medium]|nr:WRKY transcription factor [Trifolium medium]
MGGRDVEGLEKSKGLEGEMQGIEEPPSRPKK